MFEQYGAQTTIGRSLRQGDARTRLKEMDASEPTITHQLTLIDLVERGLARKRAEIRLDTQYLAKFGVLASERHVFRTLLQVVAENGSASLQDVARMTKELSTASQVHADTRGQSLQPIHRD